MTYNVITIEREYASGGREIGQLVAEKLGVPYYADEILHIAAKRIGLPPEYVERQDETAPNSLLYSLSIMGQTISYGAKGSAKANPF